MMKADLFDPHADASKEEHMIDAGLRSAEGRAIQPLPQDTARVAHSPLRQGNLYKLIGDQLDTVFEGVDLESLQTSEGFAPAPVMALVTVFQYLEGLSDPQAVAAARRRIDWKYALHLPLNYSGLDHLLLLEFRERLLHSPEGLDAMERLLDNLQANGLLNLNGNAPRKPLKPLQVLHSVRTLNRLILVMRTMCLALEAVAAADEHWLADVRRPYWHERYGHAPSSFHPPHDPEKREALALAIGADGFHLLEALKTGPHAADRELLPELELLRHVWRWQFELSHGEVTWRPSRRSFQATAEGAPSSSVM